MLRTQAEPVDCCAVLNLPIRGRVIVALKHYDARGHHPPRILLMYPQGSGNRLNVNMPRARHGITHVRCSTLTIACSSHADLTRHEIEYSHAHFVTE